MTTVELVFTILCLILAIFNTYMAATTPTDMPQLRILFWCSVLLPALAVVNRLVVVYMNT
jgi:hypothetical protein